MESLEDRLKECKEVGEAVVIITNYLKGVYDKENPESEPADVLPSVAVQTLIYDSYCKFGFITAVRIERLRLKHRLQVVHQLENGIEKMIIKSLMPDGFFKAEELEVSSGTIFNFFFSLSPLLYFFLVYLSNY